MQYKPLISVIIPTFNYANYLMETIDSVQVQTYHNVELIVVDDESTEDIARVAKRYSDVAYVRIKHEGKRTPAHASNFGATLAHGKFLIFLGADDKLKPRYVEACLNRYLSEKNNSRVGFVWTGFQGFGDKSLVDLPSMSKITWLLGWRYVGGQLGAALIPKNVFNEVGGLDETLDGCEDYDWCLRALKAGFCGLSVGEPLHLYRLHGKSVNSEAARKQAFNKLLTKYFPYYHYLAFVLEHLKGLKYRDLKSGLTKETSRKIEIKS